MSALRAAMYAAVRSVIES